MLPLDRYSFRRLCQRSLLRLLIFEFAVETFDLSCWNPARYYPLDSVSSKSTGRLPNDSNVHRSVEISGS